MSSDLCQALFSSRFYRPEVKLHLSGRGPSRVKTSSTSFCLERNKISRTQSYYYLSRFLNGYIFFLLLEGLSNYFSQVL